MDSNGMGWLTWVGFRFASLAPRILLRWFWARAPEAQTHLSPREHFMLLKSIATQAKPHEREVGQFDNDNSVQLWLKSARESFRRGVEGSVQDILRLTAE